MTAHRAQSPRDIVVAEAAAGPATTALRTRGAFSSSPLYFLACPSPAAAAAEAVGLSRAVRGGELLTSPPSLCAEGESGHMRVLRAAEALSGKPRTRVVSLELVALGDPRGELRGGDCEDDGGEG